jgi:hypothetical protein
MEFLRRMERNLSNLDLSFIEKSKRKYILGIKFLREKKLFDRRKLRFSGLDR